MVLINLISSACSCASATKKRSWDNYFQITLCIEYLECIEVKTLLFAVNGLVVRGFEDRGVCTFGKF
jgi:hypothetical protein